MKTIYIKLFVLTAMLSFAPSLFAATFQYVDTSGNLRTVIAENTSVALATAPNIASDSGVMNTTIVSANTIVASPSTTARLLLGTSCGQNLFAYINTSGTISTVSATNATVALLTATNIASDSGVIASCIS